MGINHKLSRSKIHKYREGGKDGKKNEKEEAKKKGEGVKEESRN